MKKVILTVVIGFIYDGVQGKQITETRATTDEFEIEEGELLSVQIQNKIEVIRRGFPHAFQGEPNVLSVSHFII